ncbi:PilZ domain-containing protein [Candidatus Omnitrophota bacterium]
MGTYEEVENRREFKREETRVPIRFEMKSSREFGAALTRDISEGGVRITFDGFFPLHTQLQLAINLSDIARTISALGVVAWSRVLPYSGRHQLGIQFLEMDEWHKKELSEYLGEKRFKAELNL